MQRPKTQPQKNKFCLRFLCFENRNAFFLKKLRCDFIFTMRLDLFLKSSRLILRRTLAKEFCKNGLVQVNGKIAKSSCGVQTGDEIEIKRHTRITKVKVLLVPEKKQVSKKDASNLYEIISDETVEEEVPFEISLIPNS